MPGENEVKNMKSEENKWLMITSKQQQTSSTQVKLTAFCKALHLKTNMQKK